jgi:hypothetical protein
MRRRPGSPALLGQFQHRHQPATDQIVHVEFTRWPSISGPTRARDTAITGAYAATTRSIVAVLGVLNEQVEEHQGQVEEASSPASR